MIRTTDPLPKHRSAAFLSGFFPVLAMRRRFEVRTQLRCEQGTGCEATGLVCQLVWLTCFAGLVCHCGAFGPELVGPLWARAGGISFGMGRAFNSF